MLRHASETLSPHQRKVFGFGSFLGNLQREQKLKVEFNEIVHRIEDGDFSEKISEKLQPQLLEMQAKILELLEKVANLNLDDKERHNLALGGANE